MGQTGADRRKKMLKPYAVDQALMAKAAKDAIFMHCLPAYRGHEVTEERDRRAAIGDSGRGGKSFARAEGDPGVVPVGLVIASGLSLGRTMPISG